MEDFKIHLRNKSKTIFLAWYFTNGVTSIGHFLSREKNIKPSNKSLGSLGVVVHAYNPYLEGLGRKTASLRLA